MKGFVLLAICALFWSVQSKAVSFQVDSKINQKDKLVLEETLQTVMSKLPTKFLKGLPQTIKVQIKTYKGQTEIPTEICGESDEKVNFKYGKYFHPKKTLTLNRVVVDELAKGKNASKALNCQHKSTYDQAIATIIHELTHAYDFKNKKISKSDEFIEVSDFKKSLLSIKRRNVDPMRSADEYEFKNVAEAFAVNMEYFTMDEEFACRRPLMFDFYKKHFEVDPFPGRSCKVNNTILLTTQMGMLPYELTPDRVYRIDYLLASKGDDMVSGFGHSMFRIVMCAPEHYDNITKKMNPASNYGERCLDDKMFHVVLSFRANVQDSKLNMLKGLVGGYASMLFMLNFGDVLYEYNSEELRDVISYPLNLTQKEKETFLNRIVETHWNYKGNYKFITNNCAVESLNLVDNFVETRNNKNKSRLTPYGVLKELIRAGLVTENDPKMETFPAKSERIVEAYKLAYNTTETNENKLEKAILKHLKSTTSNERMEDFAKIQDKYPANLVTKADLIQMLNHRLKVASFSVLEQQGVRVVSNIMKKKLGEYAEKMKDKELSEDEARIFAASNNKAVLESFTRGGYGIPLKNEVVSVDELTKEIEVNEAIIEESKQVLKRLFPEETSEIDQIGVNLELINSYALKVRRTYKKALDYYVERSLTEIQKQNPELLKAALVDDASLLELRKILGEELVTETEITAIKLRKMIQGL